MFLMHRDILAAMKEEQSHSLLVTGGTGLGKTTLIEAWIEQLEQRAKASGRPLMTIRFTPHLPDNVNTQLNYLSGKLNIKSPEASSSLGWLVSLHPKVKFPPFINIDFKIEGNKPSQPGTGEYPLDQQAKDAREQLVRVASKKSGLIFGKVPIVVVTIEKLTSPEMLGEIKQIFDANAELSSDNKIYFLVSGNLNLHRAWWIQRVKEDALMTEFTDIYLGHVWSLHSFCEQVIGGESVSDRKLLPKFANYLVIESSGRLRQAWELLAELSKKGIAEQLLNRVDRFYNLLLTDERLIQNFAPSMSLQYSQAEFMDRLKWGQATFVKWFTLKWVATDSTVTNAEIEQLSSILTEMLPPAELRQKFIDTMIEKLVINGFLKRRANNLTVSNVICPNCASKDNRPSAVHCASCGFKLPEDVAPAGQKSGQLCPHCLRLHVRSAKFCPVTGKPLTSFREPLQTKGELTIGSVLQSRYPILQMLGSGGYGSTYLTGDLRLPGKKWAIKEMNISPSSSNEDDAVNDIKLFQEEAKVLSSLNHPNAVRIADFFTEHGRHYLVMDFIEGENLQQRLQSKGPFSEKEVKEITLRVLDVLDYLHSQNPPVIFRDVKPSNIMITPKGQITVIDFGIARVFKPGQRFDTRQIGTPAYAPPEQYGSGQTDARSDIYGLGATMFHLLTGTEPPHFTDRLSDPIEFFLPKSLNSKLKSVIQKAMEVNSNNRFQSVREMKQALEQVQV